MHEGAKQLLHCHQSVHNMPWHTAAVGPMDHGRNLHAHMLPAQAVQTQTLACGMQGAAHQLSQNTYAPWQMMLLEISGAAPEVSAHCHLFLMPVSISQPQCSWFNSQSLLGGSLGRWGRDKERSERESKQNKKRTTWAGAHEIEQYWQAEPQLNWLWQADPLCTWDSNTSLFSWFLWETMNPDYLSMCTQEMSPTEKGPQVLLTHTDDTVMKSEVTGYISQRWAVRSLEGKEKNWATAETRDPNQYTCHDSWSLQRIQDSFASCMAPVLLIWGAGEQLSNVCLQTGTLLSPVPAGAQVKTFTDFPQLASLLRGHKRHIPREVRSGCARSLDKQATLSAVHQDKGIKNSCSCSPIRDQ